MGFARIAVRSLVGNALPDCPQSSAVLSFCAEKANVTRGDTNGELSFNSERKCESVISYDMAR